MGDGIMVFFGAPLNMEAKNQVESAVECAKDMLKALDQLNKIWQKEGLETMGLRIGIHHGKAIVGNFGGVKRQDYTVIGPAVNLASRIESVSEPGKIFISNEVKSLLKTKRCKSAGKFSLKGLEGEIELFNVDLEETLNGKG